MVVGGVVSGGSVMAVVARVWKSKFQSGKVSKFQGENCETVKASALKS